MLDNADDSRAAPVQPACDRKMSRAPELSGRPASSTVLMHHSKAALLVDGQNCVMTGACTQFMAVSAPRTSLDEMMIAAPTHHFFVSSRCSFCQLPIMWRVAADGMVESAIVSITTA